MAQCRHRAIAEHPFLFMTHPFDQSLSIESPGPHLWRSPSSPLYWNAIGPYGGWIAAMLLHAVQSEPAARGDPIALQAQFAGPIRQAPFTLVTSCLRQNRSTAFWRSELRQLDETGAESVCAHASITLSSWRDTATISDAVMPMAAPAPGLAAAPPRRFGTPEFVHRYDFRPVRGILGQPADDMNTLMWVRDAEPRTLDARSLTALCDAPLPSIWPRMSIPALVTTVVYNIFFRVSQVKLAAAGQGHVLLESRCATGTAGFFDQDTNVWSERGLLLAQTQQLVWFSDKPQSGTS